VAVGFEIGDGGLPGVAGAAVGSLGVEGDRLGPDGDGHVAAGQWLGGCDGQVRVAAVEVDHGAVEAAVEEVDADEVGDVAGGRTARDPGGRAGLGDAAGFDDDETVGENERVDGVVG